MCAWCITRFTPMLVEYTVLYTSLAFTVCECTSLLRVCKIYYPDTMHLVLWRQLNTFIASQALSMIAFMHNMFLAVSACWHDFLGNLKAWSWGLFFVIDLACQVVCASSCLLHAICCPHSDTFATRCKYAILIMLYLRASASGQGGGTTWAIAPPHTPGIDDVLSCFRA